MSLHAAVTAAPPATRARAPGEVARVGAVITGVALVANLSVLLVGRVAGADMVVGQPGATAQTAGVVQVVVATLVGLVVGLLVLAVVRNRGPRAWTAVAVAGLVVGIATVAAPLSMTAETATHATLAAMHVITGVVWFLFVQRASAASRRIFPFTHAAPAAVEHSVGRP